MQSGQPAETPIAPVNWLALVNDTCDFDLAFSALEGFRHFHTETLRGRTRSLQFRSAEAEEHFDRAEGMAKVFERTERNRLRLFYLKLYRFDNLLIEMSAGGPEVRETALDEALAAIFSGDAPDTEAVRELQLHFQGIHLLHKEDYLTASRIFGELLEQSRNRVFDEKAGIYFTSAVAAHGLGDLPEAERHMENGCLLIPTLKYKFNMGFYACTASAILKLWGREEGAQEWLEFLRRIGLPGKTTDLLLERMSRIVRRSTILKRVFLF